VTDNFLRDALAGPLLPSKGGQVTVPNGPGLGYVPDIAAIASLRVERFEIELSGPATP
jgi:hypothetical protein